jgi:hypothetical protein
MNRFRKRLILERAEPVSEMATEVREGFDNLADAVRTLCGVMASIAAGQHTHNPGDQRNMAAVIFADASERFGDVHKKLDPKLQKQMESWLDGLCKTKR